jgi:hypothetical protein
VRCTRYRSLDTQGFTRHEKIVRAGFVVNYVIPSKENIVAHPRAGLVFLRERRAGKNQ